MLAVFEMRLWVFMMCQVAAAAAFNPVFGATPRNILPAGRGLPRANAVGNVLCLPPAAPRALGTDPPPLKAYMCAACRV